MLGLLKKIKRKLAALRKVEENAKRIAELEKRIEGLEKENRRSRSGQKAKTTKAKTSTNTKSKAYQKKVDEMVKKVCAKTGWNDETARVNFQNANERTGCTPKEYYLYRMYEMTADEQDTVLVASIQKLLQKKYGVNKEFVNLLYDKEKTNVFFDEYIRRPWCVNTKVTFEEFVSKFENAKRIIYKPLDGNRGRGVEAFDINEATIREVYDILSGYPGGVVEQYVVQHPDMLKMCPTSVNTIRVVTFSSNSTPVTEDGKYMDIAYTSLRIGGGSSIVDNFHSGGMVSHIDIETGTLITDAADMECNVFEAHPMTGFKFKGFKIPYYEEVIKMVTDAITKNQIEGYLGWDIAIAEDGPILIEVNDRPGVVLLSTPYAAQKKGMKYVLAKYL